MTSIINQTYINIHLVIILVFIHKSQSYITMYEAYRITYDIHLLLQLCVAFMQNVFLHVTRAQSAYIIFVNYLDSILLFSSIDCSLIKITTKLKYIYKYDLHLWGKHIFFKKRSSKLQSAYFIFSLQVTRCAVISLSSSMMCGLLSA